jgi:cysteine desulfurase
MNAVYLDHNATTPLHPRVKDKIREALDKFGNPSSAHARGREARAEIEAARRSVADLIGASPEEVFFTASGTEANNTVIRSLLGSGGGPGGAIPPHVVTSVIEHPSVLETLRILEGDGVEITRVPVDGEGIVDPDDVRKAIRPSTRLVTIMHANNEIGTIQPVEEIGAVARDYGVPFHTDAVQSAGKVPVNVEKIGCSFLSLSGHKLYAPKGVGVLYVRQGARISPLVTGGHQENGLRAGTENTIGILALGEAARAAAEEMQGEARRERELRDRLEDGILSSVPGVRRNGHPERRLSGTTSLSFSWVEGESILLRLDLRGISVSTGSACSSGSLEPSHVITALGVPADIAHGSIRFSLGRDNTVEEIDRTIEAVREVVASLRRLSPLVPAAV